jgi:hypothetical protein
MAQFEVHYSFTCRTITCKTKNENRIEIDAPDRRAGPTRRLPICSPKQRVLRMQDAR